MILTSSYTAWQSSSHAHPLAISSDRGKDAKYCGDSFIELAPPRERTGFWRVWKNNIGKVPEDENNMFYVREFYNQVLKKLNPEELYNKLDGSVLLCYESNMEFCHRHIVAYWFELTLGLEVYEAIANGDDIHFVSRPSYIRDFLKEVMKNSK